MVALRLSIPPRPKPGFFFFFSSSSTILSLLLLAGVVLAADPAKDTFTYPTAQNLVFHYRDTIVVGWLSNYTDPELYLWCRPPGLDIPIQTYYQRVQPFNNTQNVPLVFKDIDSCWFNLKASDNNSADGFNSVTWKFDPNPRGQQTTLGLSVPTSSAINTGPSTATDQPVLPPGQSPDQSSSSSSDSNGLSTGAKAGVAVGVALAVAIGGLMPMILRRRRQWLVSRRNSSSSTRNNNNNQPAAEEDKSSSPGKPELYGSGNVAEVEAGAPGGFGAWVPPRHYVEVQQPGGPQELGSPEPQELDGTPAVRPREDEVIREKDAGGEGHVDAASSSNSSGSRPHELPSQEGDR